MSENNFSKSCAICSSKVKNVEVHLSDAHKINVEVKILNFGDVEEFFRWKHDVEKETVSRYVKQYGAKRRKDGRVVTYYHCHRDGNYIPKGRNKRSLKRIGSNKINGTCPSLIKTEQVGNGVRVRYVATHVGHTCDIGRVVLTNSEKSHITAKTTLEVPVEDTVCEKGKSCSGKKLQKIDIRNNEGIRNMIVQYNLEKKHKPDEAITEEVQCTEACQSSFDLKELRQVEDLGMKKHHLLRYITKIIQNIETEVEFSEVEKILMNLTEIGSRQKSI